MVMITIFVKTILILRILMYYNSILILTAKFSMKLTSL